MLKNLSAVEERVYRAFWNDGLLDLFAAIGVLGIGLFWVFDRPVGAVFVPVLLVPLWGSCRQRFIEPRLGMVEFCEDRQRRNNNLLKVVIYLGIGCLVLAIELYFARDRLGFSAPVSLIAGLPAFLLAILAVIASVLVSTSRFVGYAALLAVVGVVGAMNDWQPGTILVAAGISMLFVSSSVVIRFFRENPVVTEDLE